MSEPSLEYFVTIGEELNITQAARKLHISQQSLSTYLQKLEEYYGTQLFVRKPEPGLTEAGALLWEAGRHCLDLKRGVYRNIRNLAKIKNTISLGIYTPNGSLLMDFIPLLEFGRKYPNITFNVSEERNQELRSGLAERKLDLVISAYNGSASFPDFEVVDLYTNTEYIMISDRLLKEYFPDRYPRIIEDNREGVQLSDFSHVPVVLPPSHTGFSIALRKYCQENQVNLNIVAEMSNRYLSNNMVFDGIAFGFSDLRYLTYMRKVSPTERFAGIHAFPIVNPPIHNTVAVMYRKGEEYSAAFHELVQMIREKNDFR